jgi:hypothetical protein
MASDNGKGDAVEVRVRVLEEIVSDAKKWTKIAGAVILGMFGLGVFQLPAYIKTIAEEKAKSVADSAAEKEASKELTDRIKNYGDDAKKALDSVVKDHESSAKALKSVDDARGKAESLLATLEGAKPGVEDQDLKFDLKHGLVTKNELTFSFEVKHCWYYALSNDDFGHRVEITLTIDGKKVRVDTGKTQSRVLSTFDKAAELVANAPEISIRVFATNF